MHEIPQGETSLCGILLPSRMFRLAVHAAGNAVMYLMWSRFAPHRSVESLGWICLIFLAGCETRESPEASLQPVRVRVSENLPLQRLAELAGSSDTKARGLKFDSCAHRKGLEFTYQNGSVGHRLMSEGTGGGCGWLDFDRDGLWDLYLVQGGVADADPALSQPSDQLYRNLGDRFQEVSLSAGILELKYGQGITIGDLDNDGFDDVFVTNIGGNTLWRNQGDGTFVEDVAWTETRWTGWSSSAAWGDVDLDGDLDLYVCNYCDFSPRDPVICRNSSGEIAQCQPNQVNPVPDHYYENLGDGRFRECAFERGLKGEGNRALGVVIANFVGDHRPEILVANDATANFLFVEEQPGHFVDMAARFGCAFDANGRAQANMGIAIGDYDRNGTLDAYVTHFEGEWNTLYSNDGESGFHDATAETGALEMTLPWVGFGLAWQDFDQDGFDEILVGNGHIDDQGRKQVLTMPPQLLSFDGQRWHDVGSDAGPYFSKLVVGRAVAEADMDGDGDLDVAVVHQNTPMELLENQSRRGNWLSLEFIGRNSNRQGIGVRVVILNKDRILMQELAGGVGYCSSRQPRLTFGLGNDSEPCDLEVVWPAGNRQRLTNVHVNQLHQIVESVSSINDVDQ